MFETSWIGWETEHARRGQRGQRLAQRGTAGRAQAADVWKQPARSAGQSRARELSGRGSLNVALESPICALEGHGSEQSPQPGRQSCVSDRWGYVPPEQLDPWLELRAARHGFARQACSQRTVADEPARVRGGRWLDAKHAIAARMIGLLRSSATIITVGAIGLLTSCQPVSLRDAGASPRRSGEPTRWLAGCRLARALPGVLERTGTGPAAPGYQWAIVRCHGFEHNAIGGVLVQVIAGSGLPSPGSRALPCGGNRHGDKVAATLPRDNDARVPNPDGSRRPVAGVERSPSR
jgi:hypothetical protein